MKTLNKTTNTIDLNERLQLRPVTVAEFVPHYSVHFGEKYKDSFMRNKQTWQGRAAYLQNCYLISKPKNKSVLPKNHPANPLCGTQHYPASCVTIYLKYGYFFSHLQGVTIPHYLITIWIYCEKKIDGFCMIFATLSGRQIKTSSGYETKPGMMRIRFVGFQRNV